MCENCKKAFVKMMGDDSAIRDFGMMDGHIVKGVPSTEIKAGVKTVTIRTFCGKNIVETKKAS